jgi:hypothetical protein
VPTASGEAQPTCNHSNRSAGTENGFFLLFSTDYLNSRRTTPSQSQTIVREPKPRQSATTHPESPAFEKEKLQ